MEQDPVPSCLPLKIPTFSLPGKAGLELALPGPQSPILPPVLPLPLPSSFLGCVYLTSAFWCLNVCLCLCHCLFLFSLLLLAPVDIKVIKDLPWPPPVGQLDSSPSLPDGDRDISGPASPLPEPSLEDSSGGSFGDLWPG